MVDLAIGHLKALQVLQHNSGINVWNLGTGTGYSVLQIIQSFEDITGITFPTTSHHDAKVTSPNAGPTPARLDGS